MKQVALFVLVFVNLEVFCASKRVVPGSSRLLSAEEEVYRFQSDLRLSQRTAQMRATYTYDVIVRQNNSSNRVLARIENVEFVDKLENPSESDLEALQSPFLVVSDEKGQVKRIVVTARDNRFSLDQKDTLLSLMTFNQAKLHDIFEGSEEVQDFDETPLGNCSLKVNVTEDGPNFHINYEARRRDCTGKPDFAIDSHDVSPDSVLSMRTTFQSDPLEFKRADISTNIVIESRPKMRMKASYSYEFIRRRPVEPDVRFEEPTLSYTFDEFERRLEQLKGD